MEWAGIVGAALSRGGLIGQAESCSSKRLTQVLSVTNREWLSGAPFKMLGRNVQGAPAGSAAACPFWMSMIQGMLQHPNLAGWLFADAGKNALPEEAQHPNNNDIPQQ